MNTQIYVYVYMYIYLIYMYIYKYKYMYKYTYETCVYEYVYKDTIPDNMVRRAQDKHKIEDTYKYDIHAYILPDNRVSYICICVP